MYLKINTCKGKTTNMRFHTNRERDALDSLFFQGNRGASDNSTCAILGRRNWRWRRNITRGQSAQLAHHWARARETEKTQVSFQLSSGVLQLVINSHVCRLNVEPLPIMSSINKTLQPVAQGKSVTLMLFNFSSSFGWGLRFRVLSKG